MDHAFVINCHKEVAQTGRLVGLLREQFPASRLHVWRDGPEPCDPIEGTRPGEVTGAPHEPDKCRGVLQALGGLVAWAKHAGVGLVSFLHPDMVPTDRAAFRNFLLRFYDSGKALTTTPMWPGHPCPSFCNLHFRLPDCLPLFPIGLADATAEARWRASKLWFNEYQLMLSWDDSWPEWRDHAYPLGLLTLPHRDQYKCAGEPVEKVIHGPGYEYQVNDYCPETSVLHTHDPRFWENADALVR